MLQQYFYIYIHAYPSDHPEKPNQIFYVGKDCKKRYLNKYRKYNQHHQNILNKLLRNSYIMEDIAFIIKDNLYESVAFLEEIKLIKKLGRIDLETGNLTNLTDGGFGGSCNISQETKNKIINANIGRIVSQETRDKISKSNTGKTHSQETKNKMSKAHQNMSQETRDRMSKAHQNTSQQTRDKLSKARTISTTPKDKLIELYITQKLSFRVISQILRVSISTVRKWLISYSIQIRNKSEAQKLRS